ncbi:MAG: GrdX family protein [Fusobacteriaceae bacterium]
MKQMILSNNPKVKNELNNLKFEGNFDFNVEIGYLDVLCRARNLIHLGHTLLTHPLSGSIKPSETPYKSIVLSEKPGKLDYQSMEIIEDSIELAKQMIEGSRKRIYTDKIREDFQLVDYALLQNALESINQFR